MNDLFGSDDGIMMRGLATDGTPPGDAPAAAAVPDVPSGEVPAGGAVAADAQTVEVATTGHGTANDHGTATDPGTATGHGTPSQPPGTSASRNANARLARIHLHAGLLSLARAELETLAGQGALDAEALVDLAEVRWRTGDIVGAGEAARACVEAGIDETIVLVVAAEAAAASGRTGDARELVSRVVAREPYRIDALFAGMPRSPLWPAPALPALPEPIAGGEPWRPTGVPTPGPFTAAVRGSGAQGVPGSLARGSAEDAYAAPAGPALPDPATVPGIASPRTPVPDELADIQAAVARRETAGIGVRLSIVLRAQPALAAAVLSVAEDALRASPEASDAAALHLVRSDAYRLMGRETLSRQAVQQAHGTLRAPRDS